MVLCAGPLPDSGRLELGRTTGGGTSLGTLRGTSKGTWVSCGLGALTTVCTEAALSGTGGAT